MTFNVQNSPTDATLGSHTVTFTETIYIDAEDFRLDDDPNFYRLTPGKPVGLNYQGGNLVCDKVVKDGEKIAELICHVDVSERRKKPKSYITWVPSDGLTCEVRAYNHLFTETEPSDRWEEELNPDSEVVYPNAMIDPSVTSLVDRKDPDKWKSNQALQFERLGYFVLDIDTTFDYAAKKRKLVFNRTVSLKEDKAVVKKDSAESEQKRKQAEQQRNTAATKEKLMAIDLKDFFRLAPEYEGKYGKFDDTGLPTHLADGTELTQSAKKKLAKKRDKFAKKSKK